MAERKISPPRPRHVSKRSAASEDMGNDCTTIALGECVLSDNRNHFVK